MLKTFVKELKFLEEINFLLKLTLDALESIGCIRVGSNITINGDSSPAQFVFAAGIMMSKIRGAEELGLTDELEEHKATLVKIKELSSLSREHEELQSFKGQQKKLVFLIEDSLSPEEKVELFKKNMPEVPEVLKKKEQE